MMSSLSCDNIYDDPSEMGTETDGAFQYVDAQDYKQIVYLNFKDKSKKSLDYQNTKDIPPEWTMALHRYDCITNGGSAYETTYTDLDKFVEDAGNGTYQMPSAEEFTADEPGKITIDMSGMMDGKIEYADHSFNKVLGKWLTIDTSSMPPIYTPSNKVYILKDKDGQYAAIQFTGFSNPNDYDKKGYISFKYEYPLTIKP